MAAKPTGYELCSMKKIKLLSFVSIALVSLTQPTWGGPHGGGGSFSGGGHFGGFAGGGSRAAPAFSGGGARVSGRSFGGLSRGPQFYYGGGRMSAVRSYGFTGSASRSITPNASRRAAINHQPNRVSSIAGRSRASDPRISTAANRPPNRVGSIAGRSRVSDPRTSKAANRQTAANRQSFIKNHASERHDANWHRDWDRRHAHFHDRKVFVFINGFWWGLDPWFYPYYAYDYPYDDYGYYCDDYSANPYDYYNYSPYNYDDQSGYADSGQSAANATVSAVQSELAKLGYYNGAIDGALGDQTEAAIAHYQEDHDLSVTGTLTAATLQSLGLSRTAG